MDDDFDVILCADYTPQLARLSYNKPAKCHFCDGRLVVSRESLKALPNAKTVCLECARDRVERSSTAAPTPALVRERIVAEVGEKEADRLLALAENLPLKALAGLMNAEQKLNNNWKGEHEDRS